MNNIRICLEEFNNNLDDIVSYIECIDKQKDILSEFINKKNNTGTNDLKDIYQEFNRVFRTPVAYNAIIISIYGCFESFVDKICSAYIEMMREYITDYEQLPEILRNKHLRISGEFLSNANRFKNYDLTENEVVTNLYNCISKNPTYELNKELLLKHGGNLRIDQLFNLLTDIGIDHCKTEFIKNEHFIQSIAQKHDLNSKNAIQFINKKDKEAGNKLFEELDELVEQRNKVAHGWVIDSRLSNNKIKNDIITFMRVLGEIICDIMEDSFASFLHNSRKLKPFPSPINVYGNKILCINSVDSHLKCGDYIYSANGERYKMLKIEEIQLNNKPVEKIEEENIDIGIRVNLTIKKNWNYYYYAK